MNLYFWDHYGKEIPVENGVNEEEFVSRSLNDLKTRRPNLISHYQRVWQTDNNDYMLDFGSHTEFYILKNVTEM